MAILFNEKTFILYFLLILVKYYHLLIINQHYLDLILFCFERLPILLESIMAITFSER